MSRYSGEAWPVRLRRRLTRRRLTVVGAWTVAVVGLYLLSPMAGTLALIALVLSVGMLMVPREVDFWVEQGDRHLDR